MKVWVRRTILSVALLCLAVQLGAFAHLIGCFELVQLAKWKKELKKQK